MKTPLRRALVISLVTLLVCVGIMGVVRLVCGPPLFRREGKPEELQAPIAVRQITSQGLILADGTLAPVPHVQRIPANNPVVKAAVQHGVEIDEKGQFIGLIKVWHWCGNDPIRSHVGRINLSGLCLLAGGTPSDGIPSEALPKAEPLDFREWGLNISQYMTANMIPLMIEMETEQSRGALSSEAADGLTGNAQQ